MASALQRELLVVTGKGGVGKSTLASALGLLASERGRRTIVVEVGEQARLPALFGVAAPAPGVETELQDGLSSLTIDPDRALMEWLQALGGRVSGRVLASSSTFQYFAAAAPGAKELISMVKIWELTRGRRWRGRGRGYDLVVLDAPATGHALGMLGSPGTFGRIARVGPIASQAERVRALLEDPARSSYFAVAQGTEMAITETLELQDKLREQLGRELEAVLVNAVLPQRFNATELRRLPALENAADGPTANGGRASGAGSAVDGGSTATVRRSALLAARAVSERARFQRNQLARLRRRSFPVIAVPFQFSAELDLASVRRISAHLRRTL
ncbi:MAG TPA: ArsA family ATPase [Solirubrobacteraceae bacterium]|jgi:anion-transporting  ArsA/GET3 family ATPase|nr:ArsA family ATPase [Solirubrobacteraceae bacterium]